MASANYSSDVSMCAADYTQEGDADALLAMAPEAMGSAPAPEPVDPNAPKPVDPNAPKPVVNLRELVGKLPKYSNVSWGGHVEGQTVFGNTLKVQWEGAAQADLVANHGMAVNMAAPPVVSNLRGPAVRKVTPSKLTPPKRK
jgi:hypothetical protein